jgi:hypothetical protein
MEKKLQHLQEKFQIMTMQKIEYSKKIRVENKKLKHKLDEERREVDNRNERIYIMEATVNTISKVSLEMLECKKHARVYSWFLKDQWNKNQIVNLAQLVR